MYVSDDFRLHDFLRFLVISSNFTRTKIPQTVLTLPVFKFFETLHIAASAMLREAVSR